MTALAQDTIPRTRATAAVRGRVGALAADAVIYNGSLVAKNAAGNLVAASDAAALKVVGIAEAAADNTGGDAGDVTCKYRTGLDVELNNAGGAIGLDDRLAYVADDNSVTTAAVAAHDVICGVVASYTATKVWVYVDEVIDLADTETPLDGADVGTIADGEVDPAEVLGGLPIVIPLTFADAATATYEFTNTEKIEIIDVVAIKDGAGAANTIQVTDAADAAITNAMAFAVDKTVTRAGTIDKAKRTLAAGAGFKVVNTRAAGSSAGQLFIYAIKRAE
jgi:hypothetical protein